MRHYHISDQKTVGRLVFLAALLATAVFAVASIAVPTHARASACLAAGCGLPPSERPHGEIGTAEIAFRPQADGYLAGESIVQSGSVTFASVVTAVASPPGYFLFRSLRHSRLQLY